MLGASGREHSRPRRKNLNVTHNEKARPVKPLEQEKNK